MDKQELLQGCDQLHQTVVWRVFWQMGTQVSQEESKRSEQLEQLLLDLAAKQTLS